MDTVQRFFLCRQCYSFEPYDGKEFKSCSKCDLSSFLESGDKDNNKSPTNQFKHCKVEGYTYKRSISHNILLLNKLIKK
jgi:hypothetical protein